METGLKLRITFAVMLVCMLFLIPQACQAANLLANPGFEEGYELTIGALGAAWDVNGTPVTLNHGWVPAMPGNASYSVEETHYCGNPANGDCNFHAGSNAMSHSTEGGGESISLQRILVVPGATYTASVYAKGYDYSGDATGFGAASTDSAGLSVKEYGAGGNLLATYDAGAITTAVDYTLLSKTWSVGGSTYYVEFILRSTIDCPWGKGRTAFDDCVLDGPAGVEPLADVTGVVSAGGSPVSDATVTSCGKTSVTGSNGVYTLTGISIGNMGTQISVQCPGYLSQNKYPELQIGANTTNFALDTPPASNILRNGDFEQGGPYATANNGEGGADKNWTIMLWGDAGSYLRRESSLNMGAPEPDGVTFPWQPHGGTEASRNCTTGHGYLLVYQEVMVQPSSLYNASVWVKGRSFDDQGFGATGSGDYARLWVQELGGGALLVDHDMQMITGPTDWTKLAYSFITDASTTSIIFMLETSIGNLWSYTTEAHSVHGQVVYDDAVLDGAAVTTEVTGTVYKEGQPLSGATVTADGKTATTDANGVYTISGVEIGTEKCQVTASQTSCWSENKFVTLERAGNTVDFNLYATPANQLLTNPNFEDPDAPYVLRSNSGDVQFDAGWLCSILSADGQGCLRRESTIYKGTGTRDWETGDKGVGPGPWEPFSGTQCSRQLLESGSNAYFEMSQTVWAESSKPYKTSVMGKLANLPLGDYVSLHIQELDVNDAVVADHEPISFADVGSTEWTRLSDDFTTAPTTRKIKYALNSSVSTDYTTGWANFDVAILDGEAGTPPAATLTGTVRFAGSPAQGATVTCQGKSGMTGTNGVYTIELQPSVATDVATMTCPGYFEEQRVIKIVQGTNTINYDLVTLPVHNLLANPGFEEGYDLMIGENGDTWDVNGVHYSLTHGWTAIMPHNFSYSVEETHYKRNSPPYSFHSGANAMSHSTEGMGESISKQIVDVTPGGWYAASVWVKGWDFTGANKTGFGMDGTTDSAGMLIRELDSDGNLVENGEHPELAITDPLDWTLLKETFQAGPNTRKIEYNLRSLIHCHYTGGRTAFDDAVLDEMCESVSTITELKAKPDETVVRISGKVVSASFDGFFYIEEETRASGIKVTGTAAAGDLVDVVGTVRTVNGERTLVSSSVTPTTGGTIPKPLGMNNKTTDPQVGPSAVGLYVTIWGKVDAVGGSPFTLTDGSGANIKAYAPAGYSATPNDYVSVVGALGAEMSGSTVVPVMRAISVKKAD